MRITAQILLVASGLLLVNSANADSAMDAAKGAANAAAKAESTNPNVTRDRTTQVVTDISAKLQWEDNTQNPLVTAWPTANEHCNNLDFADHKDWRLATMEELVALAKATKVTSPEKPILKNISFFDDEFWSSNVRYDSNDGTAKAVNFSTFDYGNISEGSLHIEYAVRCVRNME